MGHVSHENNASHRLIHFGEAVSGGIRWWSLTVRKECLPQLLGLEKFNENIGGVAFQDRSVGVLDRKIRLGVHLRST